MKLNKLYLGLIFLSTVLISCENQDNDFPDFDYQTVYFASQYPDRTLQLGNDNFFDLTLDNQHKVLIKATMGGVRANKKNRIIDFEIANSLCDNLYFVDKNRPVIPMPANYYELASNQIIIPSGSESGGVEVKLTEAFFADPQSLTTNYVIPLLMTEVHGADSILRGLPANTDPAFIPDRCIGSDWIIAPKDYVLYGIKYVNPWHGVYLRRGVDKISRNDGTVETNIRHKQYVEYDEEVNIYTNSLNQARLPLSIKDNVGKDIPYNLILNFKNYTKDDQKHECTITTDSDDFSITGVGKFETKGEKNSIGGEDRDALYIEYTVDFKKLNCKYEVMDTLVVRDRGLTPEYFTVERH